MKKQLQFISYWAVLLISSMSFGQVPTYVPTNGLVSWWGFNGNANDESGNGNNGTVNGATLTSDRFGNPNSAYYFSSASCGTRIDATVNTSSIQTGLTISIWIMRVGNGCIGPRLFEFWPGTNGPGMAQWGWDNSNVAIGAGSRTSTGFNCGAGLPVSPNNVWTHIVYTNDGINGIFYKDGVLENVVPSTGNPILASSLAIGRMNHPAYDAFNGKLDDFGVWNRALSACEVSALYSGQLTIPPTVDLGTDTLTICGTSTTLDVSNSAAGNYLWNTGATSPTLDVTNSGTYFVTVTDTSGCSSTDSIYVSVIDPTITAQESAFCLGDSTLLTIQSNGNSCGALSGSLQNGLVGWWPFCGNANDESGNGNNGTVNGATLTTDRFGILNQAYSFDGVNDEIVITDNSTFNFTEFSINCWVLKDNQSLYNPGIISKVQTNNLGWYLIANSNLLDSINFGGGISSGNYFSPRATPLTPMQWVHLVGTFSPGSQKIYLNGVLMDTDNNPGNVYNSTENVRIGFKNGDSYWGGKIDDIGIWNRVLTTQEIQELYNQGNQSIWWSDGTTNQSSIQVQPTQTMAYTVSVSNGSETCTDTIIIQVNNPPNVNLGTDTLTICGTSTTLDVSNSAAGNYLWNTGAISSTLAVTNSGEYSVTVTDTLGCSASDTVYVSILNPTITAAQSAFCLGDSTIISLSNVGGSCGTISSDLQTGLGAWYPFCSNADDLSSLANNGTVNGVVLTDDYFSNPNAAYSFNGASNTINLTNPFLNGGQVNQFTMNARVNFNSLANSPNIWGKTKFWGEVNFGVDNNGKVFLRWANSITGNKYSSIVSQNGVITTNTWYDITVVFQSGTGQIYINGQPIATSLTWTAQGGAILSTTSIENSCNFSQDANSSKFGVRIQGGSPVGYLNGVLDEFRIWDYALSPILIQQNFEVLNFSSIWWSDGTTNQSSIQVHPSQTTTYSVTVSDGVGTCTDSITIQVNNPQINAGSDLSVCEGETATLTATGADTYAWDNGVVNGQPFTPTVDGYYTVTGTDTLGCSNTVSLFLNVLQPTSSTISPVSCDTYTAPDNAVYNNSGQYTAIIPNAAGCDSTITINLTVNNSNSGTDSKTACDSYTWIDGNTYTSSTTSPTFTLQNANGCDSVVTLNLTINKLQGLNAGDDITACQGDNITLTASGADTYSWTGGASNGVAFVPPTGTTIYTVTGTDGNGCTATDAVSVLVEYCLDIPGGISPNGDNANDTWTIIGLDQYPDAKVLVFDRWGQKVFSGDATNPTWNGTYEGKELPTADYYYIIELGNGEKFNGVVTLKR